MFTRYDKALVAAAGVVLSFLYFYQVSHPSAWVSAAIALLTVLGVRQATNKVS